MNKKTDLTLSEYKAIVESSPNMIWRSGIDGKCYYFNTTWLKFTGRTFEQENGDGWAEGVHKDDLDFCFNTYTENFNKRKAFEMEYRLKRHDGEYRWINDRGVPLFDENKEFLGYIGSCMDVTERVEGRKLTEMAHNDKLTGLVNRNYLEYILDYEFHKSRQENIDYILIMMDIDRFKYFNDHFGHPFGDKVLNLVAGKIKESIRKSDVAGRYGGDEFLVILQGTPIEEAQVIAERILKSVNEIKIDDIHFEISLSIGIVKKEDESQIGELVDKSDKAMYNSKSMGGNRISLY